jgi:hypothetical protein
MVAVAEGVGEAIVAVAVDGGRTAVAIGLGLGNVDVAERPSHSAGGAHETNNTPQSASTVRNKARNWIIIRVGDIDDGLGAMAHEKIVQEQAVDEDAGANLGQFVYLLLFCLAFSYTLRSMLGQSNWSTITPNEIVSSMRWSQYLRGIR